MKQIRNILFILALLPVIQSCDLIPQDNQSVKNNTRELLETDQNFSRMSTERGMKKAFLYYIAKEGALIRPEESPVTGADAIEFLSEIDDQGYEVSWKPLNAQMSDDGSLGYTYGIYSVVVNEDTITGSYVNIWKRQNGEWRFVVNSTNQGTIE